MNHRTTKLQDIVVPLIGEYQGYVLGQYNKRDYDICTGKETWTILGNNSLDKELGKLKVGTKIKLECAGGIPNSFGNISYIAKVTLL